MEKCRHHLEAGARAGRRKAPLAAARAAVGAVSLAVTLALAAASAAAAPARSAPPSPSSPYSPDATVLGSALSIARQAAAAVAPPGARIVATAGAIDRRMRLAPCARVDAHLVAGLPTWGATRVGLRCTDGPVAWRAYLPVQVQVLAPAWTSRATLPAGALVLADQWEIAEVDWAATPVPPLGTDEPIAGRTLARPVAPGQPLREPDLQARRWFSAGQLVRIVSSGPGFSIQAEGQALGHGIEGQPVRVRTEAGRIVVGQPVGESLVEIRH